MKIEKLVRENIIKLAPYTSARDTNLEGILLDANENAFGSAVNTMDLLNRYPDPNHRVLRKKLSEYLNIPSQNLFFGVGSDEIIDLLIRIFCKPGEDSVMFTAPSYGMYEVACDVNDVKKIEIELLENFQLNLDTMIESMDKTTKIIFLCSPNNPTANLLNQKDIASICERSQAIVVVDEAYIDFCSVSSSESLSKLYNNLVILRTFSKAWGWPD